MPDPSTIRRAMERYVELLSKGDTEGILALYGEHPSVEDPVGSEPRTGRDTLRAFYGAVAGKLRVELTGPIRVSGREAAMPLLAELDVPGAKGYVDVIDVMRFDEQGRIESMRAFWSPAEIRPTR